MMLLPAMVCPGSSVRPRRLPLPSRILILHPLNAQTIGLELIEERLQLAPARSNDTRTLYNLRRNRNGAVIVCRIGGMAYVAGEGDLDYCRYDHAACSGQSLPFQQKGTLSSANRSLARNILANTAFFFHVAWMPAIKSNA